MHTSAECNMTRVERNCGKEGSSWYFTMKSIFKIHQSTAKILQLVLRIVHPLNPPILSVHPSLLTLSFSSRARLSNSKKKKGESNEYRSQVIEKPITYPGSGDQLANHAVNTNHEIRYHERCWEVEVEPWARASHPRQGTNPSGVVCNKAGAKSTSIKTNVNSHGGTRNDWHRGRYVKLHVSTGLHLHTFRTRLEQAYRHEDT